jgi:hypothetical protein
MAPAYLPFEPNSCIMTVSMPHISERVSHAVLTRAEELYEHWESTWANVPKLAQFELGYKKEDVEWISIELLKVSPPILYSQLYKAELGRQFRPQVPQGQSEWHPACPSSRRQEFRRLHRQSLLPLFHL